MGILRDISDFNKIRIKLLRENNNFRNFDYGNKDLK